MRLLVTGGCGFLGSNLAEHGLHRGDEVTVFDNLTRRGSAENLAWLRSRGPVRFIHGDIRNPNDVARMVEETRPEAIYHLAGQVAMTTSLANPRLDFETNALGTLNLLEAVRQFVPQSLVAYSSTNKVFGDLLQFSYREDATRYACVERPQGFDEATPLEFHSPYGCSKGAADQYMLDWHRMYGLNTTVFRHSSMYGGRQFATYDQGWIGWFCQQAVETALDPGRAPFTISGNGKQVRDVLHAEDMVRLYFAAAERPEVVAGEAFCIGGGPKNSLSLLELFAVLEDLEGLRLRWTELPPRDSDQLVFVADIRKAGRLLDWKPQVGCREGIRRMLAWSRSLGQS
ncbi:MAG: GDP-mannose 4,6-dehydratase [Holophagaceae bacterium]